MNMKKNALRKKIFPIFPTFIIKNYFVGLPSKTELRKISFKIYQLFFYRQTIGYKYFTVLHSSIIPKIAKITNRSSLKRNFDSSDKNRCNVTRIFFQGFDLQNNLLKRFN